MLKNAFCMANGKWKMGHLPFPTQAGIFQRRASVTLRVSANAQGNLETGRLHS
jgi:hypothetical protein